MVAYQGNHEEAKGKNCSNPNNTNIHQRYIVHGITLFLLNEDDSMI